MKNLLARLTPKPGSQTSRIVLWLACTVVAGVHSWTLAAAPYQAQTIVWVFPLLTIAPGLISALLLPGEWRHWYRWGAVLMLTYASYAEFITPIIFVGTTWALHRAWVTERKVRLKDLLDPSHRRTAITGVCAKPGPAAREKLGKPAPEAT